VAKRRRAARRRRVPQNLVWFGFHNVTPIAITATPVVTELVPDGMAGNFLRDLKLVRVVGEVTVTPQSAATASSPIGLGIIRTRHTVAGSIMGTVIQYDPLSTDVDSFAQDWLWRRMSTPRYGGPLDATGLDYADVWPIDLKGRPTLRKLEKNHGLQLVAVAETTARVQISISLRILLNKA